MIHVTYGSQTGNAEVIAKRISKEIKEKLDITNEVSALNKFLTNMQKFPENKSIANIVIIVCSTTGNGDAPNNGENFMRWVKRKTHSSDVLSNVQFAILGLGDSNYTKYQYVPRQIDDYLIKLGGKKFYKRGEADDAYGLEMVVEPWINGLYGELEGLIKTLILPNPDALITNENLIVKSPIMPKPQVEEVNKFELNMESNDKEIEELQSYLNSKILQKSVISGKQSAREIVSITIEIEDRTFSQYSPGASISILPPNDSNQIQRLSKILKASDQFLPINKTHNFSVYSDFIEKYPHFTKLISKGFLTSEEIYKFVIDTNTIVRKYQADNIKSLFKEKLTNSELLQKLDILFTKYTELILKNRLNLADFLNILDKNSSILNLNLLEVITHFPIKCPRSYSLLSIPQPDNKFEIVFSVVNDKFVRSFPKDLEIKGISNGTHTFEGLCTNFLKKSELGEKLFVSGIFNVFEFPLEKFTNENKPILYICNGTGISPFISFLRKIENLSNSNSLDRTKLGEFMIFTGFRSDLQERNETIYENYILNSIKSINKKEQRLVFDYYRCLSISSENDEEEIGMWRNCRMNSNYVQDLILEHEDEVYDKLFIKGGYLMICGDIEKLYDECIENLICILNIKLKIPREKSLKIIEELKLTNRIILEKWI